MPFFTSVNPRKVDFRKLPQFMVYAFGVDYLIEAIAKTQGMPFLIVTKRLFIIPISGEHTAIRFSDYVIEYSRRGGNFR